MEQQSISVSKAGIVTSLQARCSVIAAANPIGGRYDSSNTLADNVELTAPILQRFDILCVLQDTVDPVLDERLAKFVTSSHMTAVATRDLLNGEASLPQQQPQQAEDGIIEQDLLRKYIQYARTNVRPTLQGNAFDQEKVASLYVSLRKESANSGGVPIAVRHVESILRMATAHAKMHLRDYVRDDDMDVAIKMMLESFIVAQKFSIRRSLKRSFAKYITSGDDRAHLLLHILGDMMRKEQMYQVIRLRQKGQSEDLLGTLEVPFDELEARARERRIYNVTDFCRGSSFDDAGYFLDENRGLISRSAFLAA
jgi:DNA replication licensing factor MCM2